MNKKRGRGFTLIELLVVISIIGFLATASIITINNARYKSRFVSVTYELKQMATAANLYFQSNGKWPADVDPGADPGFSPEYFNKWPKPPCPGWTYDWENWNNGNIIRITVRSSNIGRTNSNSVFFYCLETANANLDCAYSSYNLGGEGYDILKTDLKRITCAETKYP